MIGLACELILDDHFIDISKSDLVVDQDANEIQLFLSYNEGDHGGYYKKYRLFYIYGKQSRFIENSVELNGNIYYLARKQQEPYTYTLFKCNQNYIGCNRLSFEYVEEYHDLWINIDDTGKLTITTSNEVLIYTYNINSLQAVCHIMGCTLKNK